MDAEDGDEISTPTDEYSPELQESTSVDEFLQAVGFDPEQTLLTRRQAEVFVMREQGIKQATIAETLGTSRENITGIESRARANIEKARETIGFVDLVSAPVRVEISSGTDLYDAPELVFDACDEAGIKLAHNAPELMKLMSDAAGSAIEGRQVRTTLFVTITSDGTIRIRKQ
ncbi:MAG: Tfx family DNA-binding protein [Halovenus sp.]